MHKHLAARKVRIWSPPTAPLAVGAEPDTAPLAAGAEHDAAGAELPNRAGHFQHSGAKTQVVQSFHRVVSQRGERMI